MLPPFNEQGLLPIGVHQATIEDFEHRFVYFDHSDRRFRLFERLRELFRQAKGSSIVRRFLVAGSFVTSKPEPGDFDCILVFDQSVLGRDVLPVEYNLLSRTRARRIFGGDVVSVIEGSKDCYEFLEFFQKTRREERVGIVEIEL